MDIFFEHVHGDLDFQKNLKNKKNSTFGLGNWFVESCPCKPDSFPVRYYVINHLLRLSITVNVEILVDVLTQTLNKNYETNENH